MRIALGILGGLCIVLFASAAGLAIWAGQLQLSDTDPRGYLFIYPTLLGLLVGAAFFVVAIVAIAVRRRPR
jgi:hypothetical protein